MPEERAGATAAVVGALIAVAGGQNRTNAPADRVLLYDPLADTWRYGADLITPRSQQIGFAREDQLWLAAGHEVSNALSLPVMEIYDPIADSWRGGPALVNARSAAAAAATSDGVVVVGGQTAEGLLDDAEVLAEGGFVAVPGPRIPRFAHAVATIGDDVYVIGGATALDGETTATVERVAMDALAVQPEPAEADPGP
jgi:hypothetical protein